ncbi:hypothetical protein [Parvularcula lutaonensis]|uniref:Uncharacterized protein n=1 Tax=Parvularcula lutaonensis TaxID=491923 RepID=A0ABV7M822_9PROT|nr:hypothetical protein [Parvularcula lutaonensis]GGY56273.1 hypothetical protein GCM10007148_27270 [Parvularcula lutaonensis]
MAVAKRFLQALALIALLAPGIASAHRMPEVDITIATSEVGGEEVAAFTFRFHAADVLKALGLDRAVDVDLSDPKVLAMMAAKAEAKVVTEGGTLDYFGGETDGNAVYLFFTAKPGTVITDASVLSSAYESWTNRVNDERSGETVTTVYTQGGELKGHRH